MPADDGGRFLIRSYRDGDETAILDLFARSFHSQRSLQHWRWKFIDDPFGAKRISLAFESDGKLVGHYAAYPVHFTLDGESIPANQIGDTMTDAAIRHIGRGPTSILGRTALHFYSEFCEGRVGFNYGFNVANIQRFSLRFLRSDRVEPVAYRIRDLRARPLRKLSRMERIARGYRFELVRDAGAEWDELFERMAPHYGFLVRRDARYVAWRYLRCPDVEYAVVAIRKWGRLVGWIVARVRENRLTIGDALIDRAYASGFVLAVRHLAGVFAVERIDGWFPARPAWLAPALEEIFDSAPEPQDLSVMCVPFMVGNATERMRQALYYTMGDGDLF